MLENMSCPPAGSSGFLFFNLIGQMLLFNQLRDAKKYLLDFLRSDLVSNNLLACSLIRFFFLFQSHFGSFIYL